MRGNSTSNLTAYGSRGDTFQFIPTVGIGFGFNESFYCLNNNTVITPLCQSAPQYPTGNTSAPGIGWGWPYSQMYLNDSWSVKFSVSVTDSFPSSSFNTSIPVDACITWAGCKGGNPYTEVRYINYTHSGVNDSFPPAFVRVIGGSPDPVIGSFSIFPDPSFTHRKTYFNVSAWGGIGNLTYSYTGLPSSCTSSNTPNLICTPKTAGHYTVIAHVDDSVGGSANSTLNLTVGSVPAIKSVDVSNNPVDVGFATYINVSVINGSKPYSFSYSGLPPGACTSANTSSLMCRPNATGTYNVTVSATDMNGNTARRSFELYVTSPPRILSFTATPGSISWSQSSTLLVDVTGGTLPYGFKYGGLPSWCETQDADNLTCPGQPMIVEPAIATVENLTFNITVTVSDSSGASANATTQLNITPYVQTVIGILLTPHAGVMMDRSLNISAIPSCSNLGEPPPPPNGSGCPSGITYSWMLNSSGDGTIVSGTGPSATFLAGDTAGNASLVVSATLNGYTYVNGPVTITIYPLASIGVETASGSVYAGASITLSASVTCKGGSCPNSPVTYSWSLNNSLGIISPATGVPMPVFEAGPSPGVTEVTLNATYLGYNFTSSATITVKMPPTQELTGLTLSPASANVSLNGYMMFIATTACSFGNCPSGIPISWSLINGFGSLDLTNGPVVNFTAGPRAGTDVLSVNATLNGVTKHAQELITVTSPAPTTQASNVAPLSEGLAVVGVVVAVIDIPFAIFCLIMRRRSTRSDAEDT